MYYYSKLFFRKSHARNLKLTNECAINHYYGCSLKHYYLRTLSRVLLHWHAFFTKLPYWWTLSSTDCTVDCMKGKLPCATTQLHFWYMFTLHMHYIQQLPNTDPKQLHVSISIRNHFVCLLLSAQKLPDLTHHMVLLLHVHACTTYCIPGILARFWFGEFGIEHQI